MYKLYIKMDGQIFGPYSAKEAKKLELLDDTQVREEKMEEWMPASKFNFEVMARQELKDELILSNPNSKIKVKLPEIANSHQPGLIESEWLDMEQEYNCHRDEIPFGKMKEWVQKRHPDFSDIQVRAQLGILPSYPDNQTFKERAASLSDEERSREKIEILIQQIEILIQRVKLEAKMMYKLYIKKDDQIFGPYSAEEAMKLELLDDTQVREEKMEEWMPASKFNFEVMARQELKAKATFLTPRQSTNYESSTENKLDEKVRESIDLQMKIARIMSGWSFDVTNNDNLSEYEKGYLMHALEEYCHSNSLRSFSKIEKKLIAKLNGGYHIGGLVSRIKAELIEEERIRILQSGRALD